MCGYSVTLKLHFTNQVNEPNIEKEHVRITDRAKFQSNRPPKRVIADKTEKLSVLMIEGFQTNYCSKCQAHLSHLLDSNSFAFFSLSLVAGSFKY